MCESKIDHLPPIRDLTQPGLATAESLANTEAVEAACYPCHPCHPSSPPTSAISILQGRCLSPTRPHAAGEPPSQWLHCNSKDTGSSKEGPATPGGTSSNHEGTCDTRGTDPAAGKWWLSNLTRVSSGKTNEKHVLQRHLLENKKGLQLPT